METMDNTVTHKKVMGPCAMSLTVAATKKTYHLASPTTIDFAS